MKTPEQIKEIAYQTITKESKAIENLNNYINEDFVEVVNLIYHSKSRHYRCGTSGSMLLNC